MLHTEIYREDVLTEELVEHVEKGHSTMISYTLFAGAKYSFCTIIDSLIYKADQVVDEEIQWCVTFADFFTDNIIKMTKVRRLISKSGEEQVFHDQIKMNIPNGTKDYGYSMESVYQKGKGLVSLKLFIPGQPVKDFHLVGIRQ